MSKTNGNARNGAARYQKDKVRVAIVGVGNCASSFVQGVQFYRNAKETESVPGLMHVNLGGYHVRDIEFTAAFDIDADKVGKDLSEAIFSGQNNTMRLVDDVPDMGVPVYRGMTHDGLGKYLKQKITKAPGPTADIVQILKDTHTDVVVSYLPVGSEQATKWYVEQVLEAGCGFVNCIPVFIAREDYWIKRFRRAGLPIIGDDIKSQVGATIVHRTLARLFHDRGVKMLRTSQLNVGGNMDFYNMLERERLESKKISKTNAVTSIMGHTLPAEDVYIGPSDYVPWLTDRKWAHIRVEGQAFGDVPLNVEMKLEVWDSPNSAGIVIDAVRCLKLALNHGVGGQLDGPSSYLMKSPHNQRPDDDARVDDREVHRQVRREAEQPRPHDGGREEAGRSRDRREEARRRDHQADAGAHGTGPRDRREEVAATPHARPSHRGRPSGRPRSLRGTILSPVVSDARLSIAQVSPYAWESGGEVDAGIGHLSRELAARGHRVLVLAPTRSQELVRDSRRRFRAAREQPESLLADASGAPLVLGVGEVLPLPSSPRRSSRPLPIDATRTIEELLTLVAARRRPRARAVRAERLERRAAPLARTEPRQLPRADRAVVSTQVARRVVELVLGRLDAADRELRSHARAAPALLPCRLPDRRAGCRCGGHDRASRGRTGPDRVRRRRGAFRAAALPAGAAPAADDAALGARCDRRDRLRRRAIRSALRDRVRLRGHRGALVGADVCVCASAGEKPAPGVGLRAIAAGAVPLLARLPVYEEVSSSPASSASRSSPATPRRWRPSSSG